MTRRIVKRQAALIDLDEIGALIQLQSGPQRAILFLREVASTFERLSSMPGIGVRYEPDDPSFLDIRASPLSRFKRYLVFYRPLTDGVEILRILHGSREILDILPEITGIAGDDDPPDEADA